MTRPSTRRRRAPPPPPACKRASEAARARGGPECRGTGSRGASPCEPFRPAAGRSPLEASWVRRSALRPPPAPGASCWRRLESKRASCPRRNLRPAWPSACLQPSSPARQVGPSFPHSWSPRVDPPLHEESSARSAPTSTA
eukprot:scaffold114886_cov63-Phaeocystis_antarctica.AAC.1